MTVEPLRSEKTMVTVLRACAVSVATSGAVQAMQNRAWGGFSSPHAGQRSTKESLVRMRISNSGSTLRAVNPSPDPDEPPAVTAGRMVNGHWLAQAIFVYRLTGSTFLTLFVVPVLYVLLKRRSATTPLSP